MKVTSQAVQHLQCIKIDDEYGTPKDKFNESCKKNKIKPLIDICASFENHVCDRYITKKENCFNFEITDDFFMNPPYSKVYNFMKFAYEQHLKHNVNGLILVYAKTDTKFWHEFVENKAEIHFIKGRLTFNDENGKPKLFWDKKLKKFVKGRSPYPSCWIIYRSFS